jgi:TatD DNase family protein
MEFIDTHCHLGFESFDIDRDAVIARARKAGVKKMICIGCRMEEFQKVLNIAEQYDDVFAAIAIHPADIEKTFPQDFKSLCRLAQHKKIVAIGETGFDFFRTTNPSRTTQKKSFQKHCELAKEFSKPLIIHSRVSSEETLAVLQTLNGYPFVWHCFSEDMSCAEQVVKMGGMISLTGVVTFASAREIQEVARGIPLENMMVETDAPFLPPIPHRGKRCEPAFVTDTADFIAKLRNIDVEELGDITTRNAERFFGI